MMRFIKKKVIYQVYLSIIVIMALVMILVGYLVFKEQERTIIEVMRTQASTIAKSIELVSSDAMISDDKSFIVEHNLKVLEKSPIINFILVSKNNDGALLTQNLQWKLFETLPHDLQALETSKYQEAFLKNPFDLERKLNYYYVYPINFDGISWGWLHIGFSLDSLNNAYEVMYVKMGVIFLIAFFTISVMIYFVAKQIVNPIVILNEATQRIAQGHLEIELVSKREDEIGNLTHNFNRMARSLVQSQNNLLQTNSMLEEKVAERTKELAEINKTLDHRVFEEISKRRDQEQLLIQQSRFAAMGEMIGNIAHQWRQPLNALALLLQNIAISYEMERLDKALIQRVNDKGMLLINTMSTTIDDFRNFFKPNKEKELFNIESFITKTLRMISGAFKNALIDIRVDLKPDLEVYGYPNEFSQVMLNILNNAKDALVERNIQGRYILIESFNDESSVYIRISDNAGGIDQGVMAKIFDPYFSTKEEGKGTGIGLYMSKVIIETNMQGKLFVQNSDQGAIFTIRLKCKETEETTHV